MQAEFTHDGKTHHIVVDDSLPPVIELNLKPCPKLPPLHYRLAFKGMDTARGVALYRPVEAYQIQP